MSPTDANRWRLVRDILYQAMERPEKDREAFLTSACGFDRQLRREVEELLQASEGTFGAIDVDGGAEEGSRLVPGQILGHYRVVRLIGEGGMGAVYDAEDLTLHRRVALKILGRTYDRERAVRRFAREARAASALNHPGIVTVYELGSAGAESFIAMEFVEGQTLREKFGAPLPLVLEWMHRVAEAVAAAHKAGVVHRDLKPGNIMVTAAGQVKVLDFGLARRASEWTDGSVPQEMTMTGELLGTPAYMSPEQALGETAGHSSDIFSFGVILYEMACGKRPFEAKTPIEALEQVIRHAPVPPRQVNPALSPDVAALIEQCLERRPEARPASMSDVAEALQNLSAKTGEVASGARGRRATRRKFLPGVRKQRRLLWAGVVFVTLGLTSGAYLAWPGRHRSVPENSGGAPEITPVTSDSGLSIGPSISEDGKLVAYSSDRSGDGNLDIWVKQLGGGDPIRLTRDPADDVEPNISPDGTHVVFRSERNGSGIYIVPTTGGEERRIADGGRRPQYSPDGTKVLYWTGPANPFPLMDGIGKIFVLDLARSTTQQIRPEFTAAVDPIWSPDGKKVLFVGAKESGSGSRWWIAALDGGPSVEYSGMPSGDLYIPFAWQGDWIYLEWLGPMMQTVSRLAVEPVSGRPYGKPQRISASTTDAYSPSVSKTGELVFCSLGAAYNLYALALSSNKGRSKGLNSLSKAPGINIVRSLTPDGNRLVFTSARLSEYPQVWVRDSATGLEHPVTDGNLPKGDAVISPDGRSIVWQSEGMDNPGVLLTPSAGGPTRMLYAARGSPQAWSVDGSFILCDQSGVHKSIGLLDQTGRTIPYLAASNADVHASSVSSDGKWLAFSVARSSVDFTVYAAPFAPDRPPPRSEWVKIVESPEVHPNPHWSPDGGLLYFTSNRDGYNCIWALPVNRVTKRPEGQLFAVRHFHDPRQRLVAPSSHALHIPMARDKMALTLKDSSGGIWMAKLETGR